MAKGKNEMDRGSEGSGARLMSLDALRGFDMFFIMGGATLAHAVCKALGHPDCAFAQQFNHVPWEGFHFEDTIFPLFLFIAGVTFPFSTAKRLANGATKASLTLHALRRGALLVLFGLVCNGLLRLDFAHLRIPGVLQFIGFTWMVAALLYIWLGRKARIAVAIFLLLGSWLLFRFVGAPDFPVASPFSPEGNLGCWMDRTFLGSNHIYKGLFDPEGTAGILPGIVTPMLGMFAGELLAGTASGSRKTVILLIAAAVSTAAGLALSVSQPIVKALWSSSFVLVAGGYSAAMLALFYWIVDVNGWRRWTFFFTVIGMNSITIYMAQRFVEFSKTSNFFFGGLWSLLPKAWQGVGSSLAYVATCWLFLLFLYRKKIFLRV